MKVVVIGGGPAGMMAAISSAKQGNDVILLEKNDSLGRKLLITGKGRCNITSSLDMFEFIKNTPGNGKFLYSVFESFTNQDIINMLKENGLEVKQERGNRIFPVTDKSQSVLDCFENELKKNKVKIKTNSEVAHIIIKTNVDGKKVDSVELISGEKIKADKIILATGGKSYPKTGSTGDGYRFAEEVGHTITPPKASIVPLTAETNICQKLQGLSLRNVKIELKNIDSNKKIYDDFGEMLFTHFGVSGPTILSSSAHLLRVKNINELIKQRKILLIIDLKPALNIEELDNRIRRDFDEVKNKELEYNNNRRMVVALALQAMDQNPELKKLWFGPYSERGQRLFCFDYEWEHLTLRRIAELTGLYWINKRIPFPKFIEQIFGVHFVNIMREELEVEEKEKQAEDLKIESLDDLFEDEETKIEKDINK